jgi:hypothetical protein
MVLSVLSRGVRKLERTSTQSLAERASSKKSMALIIAVGVSTRLAALKKLGVVSSD